MIRRTDVTLTVTPVSLALVSEDVAMSKDDSEAMVEDLVEFTDRS
ncbi:hypothetical protein PC129_g15697 [Phytophthora cactorum]|uniref:Uncharacterized protein n=1 Tax=Phytophthora cactorum TaxID=29920 RepID=A0A329RPT3_9STRA|nr:hypothetical protein Pcac1_g26553 [Phytophthora cactorum]KAG2801859.1 hypothetical protein PC111_g19366 [Phytophthora cactorum]KAG2850101.1 hypothetical protein PC113_g17080 [Phytophthora cactorum]KAG2903915.1 hypothetical protein PC114_g12051 [Phytophthora cactorum]KAG2914539.1 hypothetical protein PC117_g18286 [Phytophthora cactorum]